MNWAEEILLAKERLGEDILRTPMFPSTYLSAMNEGQVFLKLESEQHTGSFKARGALNKIRSMSAVQKEVGMITASTGNHAQGFARAVTLAGGDGVIYLPTTASPAKVEALRHYPVGLEFHGAHALETELHAKAKAEELAHLRDMSFSEKLGGFVDSIRRETLEHQRGFVQMARSIAASDGLQRDDSS